MSHPIKATRLPPAWPTYTGSAQYVGTSASGRVSVWVDPSLGQPGLANAQWLVQDGDRIAAANDTIFGTTGQPVSVMIYAIGGQTNGTGGADHGGCDYSSGSAIEVDASFGSNPRITGLFEAELSECDMGGNLCGYSNGEALSRWCAAIVSGNALADFATAPTWYQDGMPDWVDRTEHTDQDPDSIGCGMAFISWLMRKGYAIGPIARAMVALGDSGTLAALYARLTGSPAGDAWPAFQAAVQALPNGVTTDDPFGAAALLAHRLLSLA